MKKEKTIQDSGLDRVKSDNLDYTDDHGSAVSDDHGRAISYERLSRRDLRALIFHLLYAMETFEYEVSLAEIIDNINRGFSLDIPLDSMASTTTQAVIDSREELDNIIKPLLINWRFDRLGVCTKLILRLAIWELVHTDEPHNIIINEAIELAKCFSEDDAYKFINGILDEAVKIIRPNAMQNPAAPQ
jgi:N utilization substance protein B